MARSPRRPETLWRVRGVRLRGPGGLGRGLGRMAFVPLRVLRDPSGSQGTLAGPKGPFERGEGPCRIMKAV